MSKTTADRLQTLVDNKAAIKAAIVAKGQTVGDDMSTYAAAIGNISGGDESISNTPHVGDVAILATDGSKKFLTSLATEEQCQNAQVIGVVYAVEENADGTKTVRVVGDGNTDSAQWSCVADFEITAIPSASGSYAVVLNKVAQGDFTYTKNTGSIEEFCTQLEAWLRQQDASSKAAKWEAYWDSEKQKGFLQQFKYDVFENAVSIAGCTLNKLIGSELVAYASSAMYNTVGQSATYCGMSRDRLEAYCKTNTSSNCNPTTAMNGTTQLFVTYPCSEAYYNGELGVNLRANYDTYQKYLDACMIDIECNKGILAFKDGKLMTSLLMPKIVKKQGIATKAYSAAQKALTYTKGVTGFGYGDWWLPSMYELAKLMKDIRVDQKDAVNLALAKCGYTKIAPTSHRWSSCKSTTSTAWYYDSIGVSNCSSFCISLTVSVVSAFTC